VEKQNAERLVYSQENRRNNKLTLDDISPDKFYRFGPFQRWLVKTFKREQRKTLKISTYTRAPTKERIPYGH